MEISREELHEFLELKYMQYDTPAFIENDPVCIPHLFNKKQDREIAGLLAATIAWGNRRSIVANARRLMAMLDHDPHRFIMEAGERDLRPFRSFVHRNFNGDDCLFFLRSLKRIYTEYPTMEDLFITLDKEGAACAITAFRNEFLAAGHDRRSEKHIPDPLKGSSAKRINMFLRWMVRRDACGVDFGIWERISPSNLVCPLDVHTGNVARKLGLLLRKQNDWKAAQELTALLRTFDPEDPVKYDFALFGTGIFEKF